MEAGLNRGAFALNTTLREKKAGENPGEKIREKKVVRPRIIEATDYENLTSDFEQPLYPLRKSTAG
jgi:hypothetical protein